ncbi:GGDEF domain-containing response regulator [Desulfolutivibrio sulfoxidireducens]|uniref:GGDEF domain-containing response regulator n=1 Tax=Desulfolutivibrio sulfoxidireducens TaxID=2773299 RepID=UPI00210A4354|nr:diguanylate cyclase [Desulfolutivibrio sulfoxidireducens]
MDMTERIRQPHPGKHVSVLLADPEELTRSVLGRALRTRFAVVLEAENGIEALALYGRHRPDMVAATLRLPGLDGAGLALTVAGTDPRVAVFLLGKPKDIVTLMSSLSLPAVRFVPTPADPDRLLDLFEDAARMVLLRRAAGESERLVRFFLDASPHPQAIFSKNGLEYVNRGLLRYMGFVSFHEFQASGLALGDFLLAGETPLTDPARFAQAVLDDPLDREHVLCLTHPRHPDRPAHVFQAAASRLPDSERIMLTLTDITELEYEKRDLIDLATVDPLTRAFNRRKLADVLAEETTRARRYGTPLSVILLDIDHFKKVNDTHGHDAGDTVLTEMARLVMGLLRESDRLARWGGEEFFVVAPGVGLGGGVELAERLRAAVADKDFPGVPGVTASFGVAEYLPGEPVEALVKRADAALYRAKAGGRNRVEGQRLKGSPSPGVD